MLESVIHRGDSVPVRKAEQELELLVSIIFVDFVVFMVCVFDLCILML